QQVQLKPGNQSVDGDGLPTVTANLKALLADSLQMREGDVDENVEFVDLGLDSISAVTWVRKINETYHTSIEATKVYSYPTLTQLARYVKGEAEKYGTLSRPDEFRAVDMLQPLGNGTSSHNMPPALGNGISLHDTIATKVAFKKLTSRRSRTPSRIVASAS